MALPSGELDDAAVWALALIERRHFRFAERAVPITHFVDGAGPVVSVVLTCNPRDRIVDHRVASHVRRSGAAVIDSQRDAVALTGDEDMKPCAVLRHAKRRVVDEWRQRATG